MTKNKSQESEERVLGTDWSMFEGECPECGTKVFKPHPRRSQFCSKMCEKNYIYRQRRFGGSAPEHRKTSEEVRRFKF